MEDKIKTLAEKLYDNPTLSWENEYAIEAFCNGYEFAQKENNSKLIEYIERKYGIVINRTDLDNFLNRER